MVEEKKEEVKVEERSDIHIPTTFSIWSIAKGLAERGFYQKHLLVSQQLYEELWAKCLQEGLDLSLLLNYLYTIDSELLKEEGVQSKGVQSEGVLPDQANK
ncbi:MAG: hypothetical protein WBC13_04655 [Dokdonella sp.]